MIVIDASLAFDALAAGSDNALRDRLQRSGDLHAPHLLDYEILSTARNMCRGGLIPEARAERLLDDLDRMQIIRHPLAATLNAAWSLRHNVPAYDAAYVALAQRLRAPLWTRDLRLARACDRIVEVVTL